MIAWIVSLLAHVRFRRSVNASRLEGGMHSPLGAAGSILGVAGIVLSVAATWWVKQSSVAAKSAGIYLVVLTAAYWLMRKKARHSAAAED
jgi:L-asparagine transporter-like permease